MPYQCVLCTTVLQIIKCKDPHAGVECERLEEHATQTAAKHDHTDCCKKAPLHSGQTVSLINNDRTLWLPSTVVHVANHGSYIVRVIDRAEYRKTYDHIHECHLDAVKPDMHTKVEVSRQSVITPSTSQTVQRAPTSPTAQPLVAPTTLRQAAA